MAIYAWCSPDMDTEKLHREGWIVNHKKVARIMREKGWSCRHRKKVGYHNQQQPWLSDLPKPH